MSLYWANAKVLDNRSAHKNFTRSVPPVVVTKPTAKHREGNNHVLWGQMGRTRILWKTIRNSSPILVLADMSGSARRSHAYSNYNGVGRNTYRAHRWVFELLGRIKVDPLSLGHFSFLRRTIRGRQDRGPTFHSMVTSLEGLPRHSCRLVYWWYVPLTHS